MAMETDLAQALRRNPVHNPMAVTNSSDCNDGDSAINPMQVKLAMGLIKTAMGQLMKA